MAEYLPKFLDGDRIKVTVTANVTGGQLVNMNGAPTTANDALWLGHAARDAKVGETVTVFRDDVQRPTAGAAIAKGDPLKPGANGTVVPFVAGTDAVTLFMGRALEAAANGAQFNAIYL